MNQQFCANCGKGSAKAVSTVSCGHKEPYDGNLIVVRTRHPWFGEQYTEYTVWDGESYQHNRYGAFCSRRCACEFAQDAVKAGFRRCTDD